MKRQDCVLFCVLLNAHLHACSLLVSEHTPLTHQISATSITDKAIENASWAKIKDILPLSSNAAAPQERIWQFIKTGVILLVLRLQYFFFPEQSPHWYFQLSFIGFVDTAGSTDDSREGNVRKSKLHWSAVPHRSLVFFLGGGYFLISQWPLSDIGVSSCRIVCM